MSISRREFVKHTLMSIVGALSLPHIGDQDLNNGPDYDIEVPDLEIEFPQIIMEPTLEPITVYAFNDEGYVYWTSLDFGGTVEWERIDIVEPVQNNIKYVTP